MEQIDRLELQLKRLEQWLESLESRMVMLMTEHTHPTGDGGQYFGHPAIWSPQEEIERLPERVVDWTPKDVWALRKEIERLEGRTKYLLKKVEELTSRPSKKHKDNI